MLPSVDYPFSGMTAVALKALTSSNTVKNQQYLVARLETEVIRVEGARPESPGIKMPTIAQKQNEARGKGRQERAERRARRSGEGLDGLDSDLGDTSCVDAQESVQDTVNGEDCLPPHRRGPGDEEDYQTPHRPEQGPKRLRFGESEDEVREKKRVKWDRGLSKTIYLDEIQPGERARPAEDVLKKGCLALGAKVSLARAFSSLIVTLFSADSTDGHTW